MLEINHESRKHGENYVDHGGTSNQFLRWINQKITDVCDEQDIWIALAEAHTEDMRRNGHKL